MTLWRPFWKICIFEKFKVSRLAYQIRNKHLDINKKPNKFDLKKMSKNKGDVFVYDVIAAILNNLHIPKLLWKIFKVWTSGTRRIWNQHLDIDKKPSYMYKFV